MNTRNEQLNEKNLDVESFSGELKAVACTSKLYAATL